MPKDRHLFITEKHPYPGLPALVSHQQGWRRPIKIAEDFLSALTFHFSAILNCCKVSLLVEKAMAPHSSTLAWKILRTEEPDGLQSLGSLRVGED